MTIGFLHPGAMGATIAGACSAESVWASHLRSAATADRAGAAGLTDVGTLADMIERCDTIVCICPPGAALAVATEVADAGFDGLYIDANAVSPATARAAATRFDNFVDGSIVGMPPAEAGNIRMYLAGDQAIDAAGWWAESAIEVRVIDGAVGAASALKMAYAGWTKGSAALLLAIRAFAAAEGVEADLLDEWATSIPKLAARSEGTAAGTSPKAWRFVDEMNEIASALRDSGGVGWFHDGAAEVYGRMAEFKDSNPPPDLRRVLDAINRKAP